MSDSEDSVQDEPLPKLRRFERAPENELLPLKIGKQVVRRFKDIKEDEDNEEKKPYGSDNSDDDGSDDDDNNLIEDFDSDELKSEEAEEKPKKPVLSAQELLRRQEAAKREVRQRISTLAHSIISFPQENFGRLKELRELAGGGDGVDELARQPAQKWALASLTEVFVGVAPGYAIRPLSDAEVGQKMKAETRKILNYETTFLHNYQKFLQILERNAMCLVKSKPAENSFPAKVGLVSVKCLCRLLAKLSHFNFTVNIVNCLVQLTRSANTKLLELVCSCFDSCLREDFRLELSALIAKTIANFVHVRQGRCRPQLLRVFLALRIKEVEKICRQEREADEAQRKAEGAKHMSRKARKERKRKRKVENPLLEAQAADELSAKTKQATETMKFVFTTYFRVLKRMPTTALVEPVLEGLAKFAHLINVEFFNDLIAALSNLLRQHELKLADSLRCVKTVCVILSNDGQVLNIDPLFFYNTFYAALPAVAFQPEEAVDVHVALIVDCVDVLLVKRRRVVPLKRVAAFVKRLAALAVLVKSQRSTLALLASMRTVFIAHPTLAGTLVVLAGEEEDCVMNGIFLPDAIDPDTCNGISASIAPELRHLAKHSENRLIRAFALNILHHIPSNGEFRLAAQYATKNPNAWLEDKADLVMTETPRGAPPNVRKPASDGIAAANSLRHHFDDFCKKKKIALAPANVCSSLEKFLAVGPTASC